MALNKDVLGVALKQMADNYNDVDIADIDAARLNFWKGVAETVIEHFKTAGVVIPGTFTAPGGSGGPVIGLGKIE